MDFFQSQDVARRNTTLLIVYFAVAVALMIAALYAAAIGANTYLASHRHPGIDVDWWRLDILFGVTVGTLAVISLGSLYKIWELRGGGESVAAMLGGRRINPNTGDLDERRVLNVVEEMALASGVPVPPVFLLDREDGINAFAAGFTPGDAVIGINRGTLNYLTRDELQGVIAHEFSHILNGDMRLNLRLIGLLNGILLLATIGYFILRFGGMGRRSSRGDNKSGGVPIWAAGVSMLVIGYIGLFFARLIKAAVSRQREYLADASAVQFTRNPDGLSGALKKIGGLVAGSRMETAEAESASHMFFGNAFRSTSFSPFATHPPLENRVLRIDPQFSGQFPRTRPLVRDKPSQQPVTESSGRPSPIAALDKHFGTFGDKLPLDPVLVLAAVGAPNTEHMAYAQQFLQAMPDSLRGAVHEAFSARAVVLAMLLDEDAQIHNRQLALVEEHLGAATREETVKLAALVKDQGPQARLPLIELVQSTLRELAPPQYTLFRKTVDELVKADDKIDLFEFAIQRVLISRLDRQFFESRPPRVLYPAIRGVLDEIATLLSALAHLGHPVEAEAREAFTAASAALQIDTSLDMQSRDQCSLDAVGSALDKLEQSAPAIKKRFLRGALVAVAVDGQVTVGEAEMLRAIADSLDVPVPPLFAGSLGGEDGAKALS